MKNLLTIAILIGATTLGATAQERRANRVERNAEEIAAQQTKRLTDRLSLSAEQQEAVYALQLVEAEERKARLAERREAAEQARAAREQAMKQRLEKRAHMQQQLDEILTDEQRATLAALHAERHEGMKEMRRKRHENRGQFERGERNKQRSDRRGPRPARDDSNS